jgi:hypothetical protein
MVIQQNEIIAEINKDIIRAVNREVSLKAKKFSDQLLSSVFRTIFRVERALEFAEPEVFQLEHDPERIAWSRLDSYKLGNLPVAIANEEVCANRYQTFTEYDFIALVDVSRSMMLNWWPIYGATNTGSVSSPRAKLFTSKLYFMKYILLSFLHAAQKNKFNRWVKFFGRNRLVTYSSRDDSQLEESVLNHIDMHFGALAQSSEGESPMLPEVLREVLEHKKRCIVLCISDFMDGVRLLGKRGLGHAKLALSDFVPYLAEIAYRHKMLVFRINDISEKSTVEMDAKLNVDNPYYDMESNPVPKTDLRINLKYSRLLSKELITWQKLLAGSLSSLGIYFETFDAGSLADIDKAIYRLGLVTGV